MSLTHKSKTMCHHKERKEKQRRPRTPEFHKFKEGWYKAGKNQETVSRVHEGAQQTMGEECLEA